MTVTFDRTRGPLSREDLGFVSGDHPLVRASLDLLLGSEAGNASFGVWKGGGAEGMLLEIYTVVECVAPLVLHADRFLPATPIRVVVDHALTDHTTDEAVAAAQLEKGDIFRLLDRGAVKKKLLPAMLAKAQALAAERAQRLVESASTAMTIELRNEIERLEDLRQINDHVRPEEIAAAVHEKQQNGRTNRDRRGATAIGCGPPDLPCAGDGVGGLESLPKRKRLPSTDGAVPSSASSVNAVVVAIKRAEHGRVVCSWPWTRDAG